MIYKSIINIFHIFIVLLIDIYLGYYEQLDGHRTILSNQRMACTARYDTPKHMSESDIKRSGQFNMIRACSGNAKTQRGINASIIILDEAAFIPKPMLQEVIGPLLKVKHTILIALSTFSGKDNWFSKIMLRKDDLISRLISRMQIEFICNKCKKDGLIECEHLRDLQPAHLSEDADMAKLLIPGEELFRQEVLGLIQEGNDGKLFRKIWLDAMLGKKRISNLSKLKDAHLHTWIDPKGTSAELSYLAIVTVCVTRNDNVIIVGLDECQSASSVDHVPFVRDYFAKFAQDEDTKKLPHTLYVENNFCGLGPTYYWNLAVGPIPQMEMFAMEETKYGARTDFHKHEATQKALFDIWTKRVHIAEEFKTGKTTGQAKVIEQFIEQMQRIQIKPKGGISGKTDGLRDDLAISFIMIGYFARKYIDETEIIETHEARDRQFLAKENPELF
jgi:hypothetical protein